MAVPVLDVVRADRVETPDDQLPWLAARVRVFHVELGIRVELADRALEVLLLVLDLDELAREHVVRLLASPDVWKDRDETDCVDLAFVEVFYARVVVADRRLEDVLFEVRHRDAPVRVFHVSQLRAHAAS